MLKRKIHRHRVMLLKFQICVLYFISYTLLTNNMQMNSGADFRFCRDLALIHASVTCLEGTINVVLMKCFAINENKDGIRSHLVHLHSLQ